jgi:nicotinate-nucleotide adenylyltransferase
MFGGAFDPPHRAHVALAEAAVASWAWTAVRLSDRQAWHKSRTLTPPSTAWRWPRLAFDG